MRDDWRQAWWAWVFRPARGRVALKFAYFLSGALSLLLTFNCWIWWRSDVPLTQGVSMAFASLLGHLVLAYETGYKKLFLDSQRRFFYVVWLVPCVLSVIGFTGGLFYRGIL